MRLGGFGGQGIILAGYILGKAAALHDGKEAIFTQSYGPEARGGACSASLVIDDEPIDYPMVEEPGVVALMSQEAADTYGSGLAPGATVIVDADLVSSVPGEPSVRRIPCTRLAEELGNRIVANMVMLGALTAASGVVSRGAIEEAIRTSVRERTVPLNLKAFDAGYRHVRQHVEASG